ncbi:hypothetical protein F0562_001709 [Nyssa sinensis]|uniref:Uncharacterized protein n=1 Tax=Nyssa sinensis TaxID=561372 RepID=A0A5J5C3U1_9ASTE|nr:hypothetical protein F0562_001709 [Nyssa sinensis]
MHTSTPVAAIRDSPLRLTWADQAHSGEFIPKKALDLEEKYGGFSVNTDFLLRSNSHSHGEANNGRSKEKGFGRVSQLNQLATHRHLAINASVVQKPFLWSVPICTQSTNVIHNHVDNAPPALPTPATPFGRKTGVTPGP